MMLILKCLKVFSKVLIISYNFKNFCIKLTFIKYLRILYKFNFQLIIYF